MAYMTRLDQLRSLKPDEAMQLQEVSRVFPFRASEYYCSLIDWDDPADPIRRIIVPSPEELGPGGVLDASREYDYTRLPGLQHKYRETALLLMNDICGGFCRFCFRKRLFINDGDEVSRDVSAGLDYISRHPEITNVLLTGGDPLLVSTRKLEEIMAAIRDIDHVRIIRLGTKMPAFNPSRIYDDPELLEALRKHSSVKRRIYMVLHFNHPREITPESLRAIRMLQEAGTITVAQTPILRGINDDSDTLAHLFKALSFCGVSPYYVFQCRPAVGNGPFQVPLEEAYLIFEQARSRCSGLAKRARFVMSHASGKIEVSGLTKDRIYFKYLQAARLEDIGMFLAFRRRPDACWFDDYARPAESCRVGDVVPEPCSVDGMAIADRGGC